MLNFALLCLIIVGHTTLWISFVNRTHALKLREGVLRQLRHLHDIMIVAFPPVLLWRVGWEGPRLLRGGSWLDVTPFWQLVMTACMGGVFGLIVSLCRMRLHGARQQQTEQRAQTFDVAAELGERPVASGPYFFLTRLPRNEQFQIEVNEKILHLPRLPEEWQGLSILHLSDWHLQGTVRKDYFVRATELAQETECDLICFTGDLIDNLAQLDWLPTTLGALRAPLGQYFILGNHDWYQAPQQIRTGLATLGWTDVGSRCLIRDYRGQVLEIAGDETPWLGQAPRFSSNPASFRLLLSHTPDHIVRARTQNVDLMLSGHNHGGQIRFPVLGPIYSPSLYGCKYASGLFQEGETLLHVSRGLSGRHPLRWRCRPEVSKLVLRSS
ncbi:metallophosphoesterase [Planctomicrobium sp. SH664]|uniref:metallophosphoesterase n=1 Tax=Planctomicrobium sp. SH664 TaxID=3448125 RepID=UPI003F5AF5C3